jgi:hypothetical protein
MPQHVYVTSPQGAEVREIGRDQRGQYLGDRVADFAQGAFLEIADGGPVAVRRSQGSTQVLDVYVVQDANQTRSGIPVTNVAYAKKGYLKPQRNMGGAFDVEVLLTEEEIRLLDESDPNQTVTIRGVAERDFTGNNNGVVISQRYDVFEIEGTIFEDVTVTIGGQPIAQPNQYPKKTPVTIQGRRLGI